MYLVFALMFLNAYRLRNSLKLNPLEILDTRASIIINFALVATGAIATAIALMIPPSEAGLAGWTYATVPLTVSAILRSTEKRKREIAASDRSF